jgi:SAM-dependent methyltransferase
MDEFSARLGRTLRQMYDQISECEAGLLKPVAIERGLTLLNKLGYPVALLDSLPPESFDHAFPLANPLPKIIELAPESILDLGCGSALDALFSAHLLPQLGYVFGIDASSGLLEQGRKRLRNFPAQAARITLHKADLNLLDQYDLPAFDLILMNGSFNLIRNKIKLFQMLNELLNNEGRILIYDFLLTESLPPGFADEIDNWLWNIGGALSTAELGKAVSCAGLEIVLVEELERIDPVARCEILITKKPSSTSPSRF